MNNTESDLVTELKETQQKMAAYIQEHWRLFLFEGVLFIILGVAAILIPQFFSVVMVIFLGWLIVIAGAVHTSRAFYFRDMPGFWLWLVSGILQMTVGYLLIANPIAGVMTLTMMMALFFAFEGIIKIYMALKIQPLAHWNLVLFSGITSLVFAVIILAFWSQTAPWLLGLLIGVNMIFFGGSMVKMSLMHKDSTV